MFSDIAGVRTALASRLKPLLPTRWKVEAALKEPPAEFLSPLIVFEFTRITSSTTEGAPLPPGTAGAEIDLIVGTPKTREGEAEDDVDELVLTLVKALDKQSDIFWASAEKQRLESGQWVWRIHTTVLTQTKE